MIYSMLILSSARSFLRKRDVGVATVAATGLWLLVRLLGGVGLFRILRIGRLLGIFRILRIGRFLGLLRLIGRVVRMLFGGEDLLFVALDDDVHVVDEGVALGGTVVEHDEGVDHAGKPEVGGVGGAAGRAKGSGGLADAAVVAVVKELLDFLVGGFERLDVGLQAKLLHLGGVLLFAVVGEVDDEEGLALELHVGVDAVSGEVVPERRGGFGLLRRGGSGEAFDGRAIAYVEGVALAVGGHDLLGQVALARGGQPGVLFLEGGFETVGGCLGDRVGRDGCLLLDAFADGLDKAEMRTVIHTCQVDWSNLFRCRCAYGHFLF